MQERSTTPSNRAIIPAKPIPRVRERGPAKYFHGRENVRSFFAQLREDAIQDCAGTNFLIQGAPGAGKTALLHQCAVEAAKDGWRVAEIELAALHNPAVMAQSMGEPYLVRKEQATTLDAKILERQSTKEIAGYATVSQVLKELAPETGLLLVLDEVQTIRSLAAGPDESAVMATLNAIHNGKLRRPVILLAGGLGISQKAFGTLGISRFDGGCIVNLGRLSESAERAVISDWLLKDGKAQGDVTPWTIAIAAESHGWPQHIMCFAQPAAWTVQNSNGLMTESGLAHSLTKGRQGKVDYYLARTDDVSETVCVTLAGLLNSLPTDSELDERSITEALKVGQTLEYAKREFDALLHKGIVAKTSNRKYTVPIPSMSDWLIEQFGHD